MESIDLKPATVSVDLIDCANYRETFRELDKLAASIEQDGCLQPPTLRVIGDRYRLVAGERRLRAMRDYLNWSEIPASIAVMTDDQESRLRLAENANREDVDPFEESNVLASLSDTMNPTHVAVAAGISSETLRRRLRLLKCCSEVRDGYRAKALPIGAAESVADLDGDHQRSALRAWLSTPGITLGSFRLVVSRLQADQDQGSMFEMATEEWSAAVTETRRKDEPMGQHEIAELLGFPRPTVHQWANRGVLPVPEGKVSGLPWWRRSTILAWAQSTGRAGRIAPA